MSSSLGKCATKILNPGPELGTISEWPDLHPDRRGRDREGIKAPHESEEGAAGRICTGRGKNSSVEFRRAPFKLQNIKKPSFLCFMREIRAQWRQTISTTTSRCLAYAPGELYS